MRLPCVPTHLLHVGECSSDGALFVSVTSVHAIPRGSSPRTDKCNGWTGDFPKVNDMVDGYAGTAPVIAFEPNAFGIYNMVGNVWEWTEGGKETERALRGGSYIDTIDGSYNHALRVSSRQMVSPDSGGGNTGFRCASGEFLNTDQREIAIEGLDTSADGMTQEKLQQVVAEKGIEGLTQYLAQMGQSNAKVLTPKEIKERYQDGLPVTEGDGEAQGEQEQQRGQEL